MWRGVERTSAQNRTEDNITPLNPLQNKRAWPRLAREGRPGLRFLTRPGKNETTRASGRRPASFHPFSKLPMAPHF